jgi:hypothetical protein
MLRSFWSTQVLGRFNRAGAGGGANWALTQFMGRTVANGVATLTSPPWTVPPGGPNPAPRFCIVSMSRAGYTPRYGNPPRC